MSFVYSVTDSAVAVTGAIDIVEGTVAADAPIYFHLLELLQTTDLGDAAEEVLAIGIMRGVTSGSGGTAATEIGLGSSAAPTASNALTTFRTTASTGGTRVDLFGWNIRIPTVYCPLPEHRPRIDSSDDPYSARLISAPADSITMTAKHVWEEDV